MSLETDRKIAEWLGWDVKPVGDAYSELFLHKGIVAHSKLPYYSTSDSDAIGLLPVLVERGYYPALEWKEEWQFQLWNRVRVGTAHYEYEFICESSAPTISAAICAAITSLIEKEEK